MADFYFDLNIDVSASGAIANGSWAEIMLAYKEAVERKLGDTAVKRIRAYLPTQYMYLGNNGGDPENNPIPDNAGYLVSQIHWDRETVDSILVNDGGYPAMIYGPWIEGIGPGNAYFGAKGRTARGLSPRFPGYHAFAKITNELKLDASDLAEEELPPYLAALNG